MLVDVATVETLHATSLHHQTVAYAWTVHQLCCMRAPPNPVRCRAISHRRIFICTFVGIATVETLHATSLHPRAVAHVWTVHQLYCVGAPPNPVRCRVIYHRRIDICMSVGIATVETLHATSLPPPNRRVCVYVMVSISSAISHQINFTHGIVGNAYGDFF